MENKEIYELLEAIITALYPTSLFINGNKIEIEEAIHKAASTEYPIFIYYSKPSIGAVQKANANLIEKTSFVLQVLSLQDHDYTVAQKDTLWEANKERGQIVLNNLSTSPNLSFANGEEMSYNIDRLEEYNIALLCGAGFDVSNLPLLKFVNYCIPEEE